ncbi:WYL domain-containing protein [Haematobacter genomosp. 1]|uniref:WYL domain-containing protein n=1 Tax=Haematobacter genomosp. 1 TaxID=366618 RepID=UPI001179A248
MVILLLSAQISQAIRDRQVIRFMYNGKAREVEPHLLGVDKSGDVTLSGWQVLGGTGQGWRDFHVSKLSGLATVGRSFSGARPGYNANDRTLRQVLCRL